MRVIVIEDDPQIVEALSILLEMRWHGAELISSREGGSGVKLVDQEKPDIVILDVNLPDKSGIDVLREIRAFSDVPIIILTVRGDEVDRVRGLELGADDYIVKPFSHSEFLARVRAVLRRSYAEMAKSEPLILGNLVIDSEKRQVTLWEKEIRLTPTEFNLLHYLAVNEGRALTSEMLLRRVWGEEYVDSPEYVKVYIQRLRHKLERDPKKPQMLLSIRGRGYMFQRPR
jgi:DNA-binding response OmpR family regulator